MVKCGLNTDFLVFPIGFDSARRKISLLLKNNSFSFYLFERSNVVEFIETGSRMVVPRGRGRGK